MSSVQELDGFWCESLLGMLMPQFPVSVLPTENTIVSKPTDLESPNLEIRRDWLTVEKLSSPSTLVLASTWFRVCVVTLRSFVSGFTHVVVAAIVVLLPFVIPALALHNCA